MTPIFFTLMVIVESLLRPGYSQISQDISYLGIGTYSYLQNVNFIVAGILSVIFGIGLGKALSPDAPVVAKRVKWTVVIFGVGVILAGITLLLAGASIGRTVVVPAIPAYYVHTTFSLLAFVAIIPVQFLTWQAVKRSNRVVWGRYGTYTLLSGIVSLILLFVFLPTSFGAYKGLTERMFVAVVLIWIEITGLKLLSLSNLKS